MPGDSTDTNIGIDLPTHCTGRDEFCGAELTADDYLGMQRPTDDPSLPSTTGTFAAFACDECETTHYACTVCSGGSFEGEECGTLICHNCNPAEARRQDERRHQRRRSRRRL